MVCGFSSGLILRFSGKKLGTAVEQIRSRDLPYKVASSIYIIKKYVKEIEGMDNVEGDSERWQRRPVDLIERLSIEWVSGEHREKGTMEGF